MVERLLVFVIFCCLCSCSEKEYKKDCINPLGKLLFNKVKIEWGNIRLGEKAKQTIQIYNPTKYGVHIKVYSKPSESDIRKMDDDSLDFGKKDFFYCC